MEVVRELSRLIQIKPSSKAANLMKATGTPGGRGTAEDQAYQ